MTDAEWKEFLNKTREEFTINDLLTLVKEVESLRQALFYVRNFYHYYKTDSDFFKLDNIAFRMDEAAKNGLGGEEELKYDPTWPVK